MHKKTYHSCSTNTTITVHVGRNDLLNQVFELLIQRGFTVQTDQRILSDYPTLADTHWEGQKGDLLFKAELYADGFCFKFYQEINTKNPHGGYYDFEKFEQMPYLIRCQYRLERHYICNLLETLGYTNTAAPTLKYAIDKVMHKIKSCWHYKEGKELPEYEITSYNATDKNDKQLRNGQVKYFRDHRGRLQRGTIYHNINNMWWVVLNKFAYTNVASFELFDVTSDNPPIRRIQSKVMPQRIRANKLREKFKTRNLSYRQLTIEHIQALGLFLTKEFENFGSAMQLAPPLKKDIKILKRTGLQYAEIKVNGYYFSKREAITFNTDGFIGFAGWACDNNLTPFVNAFDKWMDWLTETVETNR